MVISRLVDYLPIWRRTPHDLVCIEDAVFLRFCPEGIIDVKHRLAEREMEPTLINVLVVAGNDDEYHPYMSLLEEFVTQSFKFEQYSLPKRINRHIAIRRLGDNKHGLMIAVGERNFLSVGAGFSTVFHAEINLGSLLTVVLKSKTIGVYQGYSAILTITWFHGFTMQTITKGSSTNWWIKQK